MDVTSGKSCVCHQPCKWQIKIQKNVCIVVQYISLTLVIIYAIMKRCRNAACAQPLLGFSAGVEIADREKPYILRAHMRCMGPSFPIRYGSSFPGGQKIFFSLL